MSTTTSTNSSIGELADTELSASWQHFRHRHVHIGSINLHYVEGGSGKPVLLIPGWPQSWYAWRYVMPSLVAAGRRVIAVDPRGLGDSDKPANGYDLGTVAQDLHGFVEHIGLLSDGPLDVAGHDVGAWIGYAWAADWPDDIRRLALYDAALPGITPAGSGGILSEEANIRTWHFGFNRLTDLPELLIQGREQVYLDWLFTSKMLNRSAITPADLDEYTRVFSAPGAARAGFDYYRALFNEGGLAQNRERGTRRLGMPVLAWGASGGVGNVLLDTLKSIADDVSGGTIDNCGHYVPEEAPEVVAEQLTTFFVG
ncbi:hypothetical protein Q668_18975 [Alcanivorax sp. PN-3]|nr:hypothetical protein Q668_18975 [Alcanivorax sp. PN-3]MBA4719515.1 alpha/beta hydrolase [Alcanivorax sp.]